MAEAGDLTELHDDVHHVALLVALIVLDDVGVIQAVQHLHLILGLHTMPTPIAAPGVKDSKHPCWMGCDGSGHANKFPKCVLSHNRKRTNR